EFLRRGNDEHAPLPARQEMRRLSHVGTARLDPVVRSDRNVELLLGIAVVVPDEERPAAVRIVEPALVRGRDAVARCAPRHGHRRLLRRQKNAAGDRAGGYQKTESCHCCFSSFVAFAVLALRSACSVLYSSSLK